MTANNLNQAVLITKNMAMEKAERAISLMLDGQEILQMYF